MRRLVVPSVTMPSVTKLSMIRLSLTTVCLMTLLLAGCTTAGSENDGGSGADSSSTSDTGETGGAGGDSSAPVSPPCDDVWKAGETLPDDYTACAAGSAAGPQDVTECLDGTQLIVFDDSVWAVTGDKVVQPDVSPVQDTEDYGAAYAECTGE